MTSNVGSQVIQQNLKVLDDENREIILERTRSEVMEELRKVMRPEFLNRIDEVIMFTPLSRTEVIDIVRLQFQQVVEKLADQSIDISITDKAIELIGKQGYDPQYGARPIKRLIQKNILNELSRKIIDGSVKREQSVLIDSDGQTIVFKNK